MPFPTHGTIHRPTVTGRRGMISSAHPLASLAGLRILMEGGNAIDAAVATAAALNVVEPYMSGMGGVGYMHIYNAQNNEHKILDYMARSPKAASFDLVQDENKRLRGPMAPMVPGACGGWLTALERYGSMDASTVFAPAIEYAEQGFALTIVNHRFFSSCADDLRIYPSSADNYLPTGHAPLPGDVLTQPNLAQSFRDIAEGGSDVFYNGPIADRIVSYMETNGGLISHEDLRSFSPEWQDPIHTTYRGYRVYAPAPPCQAVQYLETLNIMEGYDLEKLGHNTAETLHYFIEAAKLATADRAEYAGIHNPPTTGLLSKKYAEERRNLITNQAQITGGERYTANKVEGEVVAGNPQNWMRTECTTHFDTVDDKGNAVSVTQSLGAGFGSAVVIPDTGIALNDMLYWFDGEPESPNAVGPDKKIEMCMSPVQVWDKDAVRMLIGTPGSYGILQTTPQMIMNVIDHGMNVQAAIEAPRVKTTAPGTVVDAETRIPESVLTDLAKRGHTINRLNDWDALVGGGQAIHIDSDTGSFMGGADPRRDGYALGW